MAERQERVGIFQNNKDIMAALLSISAAGVGLTLTASSTVVFAELHWTPGMLIQAEDRAHRIGQKNCVNCHYLIGEGTLDSMLYNYLLKKINNVSTFVDGS
jgi:SWI/SNF-related matrix-associated actin-dependent regulator 1 of chromatin subfamily A